MFNSENKRRALALAVACSSMLVVVSAGGATDGGNFILGMDTNTATNTTKLDTTAGVGLFVVDSGTCCSAAIAGKVSSGSSTGVNGESSSSSHNSFGVSASLGSSSPGTQSAAVGGISYSTTDQGPGVWGVHNTGSGTAPGVLGTTVSNAVNAAGVSGRIDSSADSSAGVRGENANENCCGVGVAGFHAGQGIGVYGEAPNGIGVSGFSQRNWSGYFQGSVDVVGTLLETAGAFRIDNPLDPANSYLQHSSVASPDMKDVYDGNVTTNAKGYATVNLPPYFQELNGDFRYQLTIVGMRGWRARVAKEIAHNQFTIQTDVPQVKVSWQVTGIRHDPYANAHRIQPVVPKGDDRGKYVHPELYGKPLSRSVVVLPGMKSATQPKFQAPAKLAKRKKSVFAP